MRRKVLIAIVIVIVVACLLSLYAGDKTGKIDYGVTFSPYQAESLELDWKKVYIATLEDLKIRRIRISAYWDKLEPKEGKFDFGDLDFQVKEGEKAGAKLVLAVGRRLPRWPECHDPEWLKDKTADSYLLSYIEAVVRRYQNSPAVEMWQVENEPFLSTFGKCPKPDANLLDREIILVKSLDPSRPVLISDSGELSLWLRAGKRGDAFGTTLYRYVFSDIFNRYWVNYNPYWLYRVKGGLVRLLYGKKELVIIEQQAEPWTPKGILNTSIEEQFRTMSLEKFDKMISLGRLVGFQKQYLWGVEWWYWMREKGHPEFWEKAKQLITNH
ncbi:MAG: beta-galactosidase [Candidatus Doudnabacteria bacterium]|nr:beta-galactosidase [Candidatus Doudnabacteria bacterium]